jgi:ketosteroid isomerase-like protein
VVIHDTADPHTIIAEYVMAGTVTTTGRQSSAPFVVILTVRDGKIVRWPEYQDTLGMALALGQLPGLLAGISHG